MNFLDLHDRLIATARAIPLDERVPYLFEKRIMARLAGRAIVDPLALWSRALGRSAVFCFAIMVVLTVGSLFLPEHSGDSLTQDVERTLFAAVDGVNAEPSGSGDTR
jgi:hypothetical protein